MIGFEIQETMSGSDSAGKPFEFNVTWGINNWRDSIEGLFELEGTVLFNGTVSPCKGTITIDYLKTNSIEYNFKFHHDHQSMAYVGRKINIKPWNLLTSHTTCFGTVIYDDFRKSNVLASTNVTFFKLKTIPKFLSSFRLRRTK